MSIAFKHVLRTYCVPAMQRRRFLGMGKQHGRLQNRFHQLDVQAVCSSDSCLIYLVSLTGTQ